MTYIKHNGEWKRTTGVTLGGAGDAHIFECAASKKNGEWYNTEIPIAGVKKIALVSRTIKNDQVTLAGTGAELDTVTDGVLTKDVAISSAGGGSTYDSALKVVDGMIYFQSISTSYIYTINYMTLYR